MKRFFSFKIVCILLLFIAIKSTVFAVFVNRRSNEFNMDIAVPIIEVVEGEKLNLNNDNLSGVYEFTIRNYNANNKINQVKLLYTLHIDVNTEYINEFKLVRVDEEYGNEKEQVLDINSVQKGLKCNEKQDDRYRLYISYLDENRKIEDNIRIRIYSEQAGE